MQERASPSSAAPAAIILNDTRVDRHHGCASVMQALEAGLAGAGFRVSATVPAHTDWSRDAGFLAALPTAKLLVVNGEGTLHHDRPAGLRLLQAARHAREHGLATALVNAGWEANGEAYAAAAREFHLVSARDSRSASSMRAAGIDCRVVPDLSLCAAPPQPPSSRDGVAYTDSVEPDVALALESLRRTAAGQALSIHQFDPARDAGWRFLRAGVGRRDLNQPLRLLMLLRARRVQWAQSVPRLEDFLRRLSGIELLVSGRFHACTLALIAGTPFIAAGSNTAKIHALVEDAGLSRWRCVKFPEPAGIEKALAAGWSTAERLSVATYLARARKEAEGLFADLPALLR